MNTQHSPGPWKLKSDPYPDGSPYFVITAGKAYFGDASDPQGFHTSIICTEADARLTTIGLANVFETAIRIEAHLLGASDRIAKMVVDAVAEAVIEVGDDEEPPANT